MVLSMMGTCYPRLPVGGSPRRAASFEKPDSIMNSARSDFLHVARERGYIHQTTEEGAFLARLQAGPLAGYIGFDATADSLHVGSLVQIMLLRLMQRTGNRPHAPCARTRRGDAL